LIWAALTLVQHWLAEGAPRFTGRRLGSYERWAEVVGGILATAGIQGFLGNLEVFTARADEETAEWQRFVTAWWAFHGSQPVHAALLLALAEATLPDVVGGGNDRSQLSKLGRALQI
jgi:hypothetical protein